MRKRRSFLDTLKLGVFITIHLVPFLAIWTGVTARALVLFGVLYVVKMFLVTGVYHRYFSHRAYKTSRFMQFTLGFLGTACLQRGPLWWAARHRHHHRYSDEPEDVHSPRRGLWQSHVGWIVGSAYNATDTDQVRDLAKYPELRWLNNYHGIAPLLLAVLCYYLAGWSGVVVGMGWSAVASWHATFTINSLAHLWGTRRYATKDTSRNNGLLALLTLGEGWHNNHHRYPGAARQGFFWWEIDVTYYILQGFAALGLIWDLREPPAQIMRTAK